MVLIIGGEGSGKRSFARNLGYTDNEMADAVLNACPVVYHVEQMVANDFESAPALLEPLSKKAVVICNEVGSGVIPVEHRVRLTREATGRLCVLLAKQADAVVRMVCGIPTVIKGEMPCKSI